MPEDGLRHEVLDGEWVVTPSPTTKHQSASKRLLIELVLQLERRELGVIFDAPVDVIMTSTRVTVPDLLVVDWSRRNRISERGIEGAPDLIIEIVSPSTEKRDREIKRKLYAEEGVREYWLVDSRNRTIEVLSLTGVGYELVGTYGPGTTAASGIFPFVIAVDEVFS